MWNLNKWKESFVIVVIKPGCTEVAQVCPREHSKRLVHHLIHFTEQNIRWSCTTVSWLTSIIADLTKHGPGSEEVKKVAQ